jgi:hypothetical protein
MNKDRLQMLARDLRKIHFRLIGGVVDPFHRLANVHRIVPCIDHILAVSQ